MLNVIADYRPGSEGRSGKPETQLGVPLMHKVAVANGITITLNIISLVFAVGMIIMMFFISQSIRDVASLEDRLSALPQFGDRLSKQMDTVSVGVHSQFEELNGRISTLLDQTAQLEKQVAKLADENRAMADRLQGPEGSGDAAFIAGPEPIEENHETVLSAPPPQPKEVRQEAPRPANPVQFEKVVSPDGKVTYSKVR